MASSGRSPWRRLVWIALGSLATLWVLLVLATVFLQETFIFPRWRVPAHEYAQPTPADVELLELNTDEGIVPAWYLPGEPGAGLVVILHGNGVVIDAHLDDARRFAARGWHVLLPEYRGYGRAAGSPGEGRITDDVQKFVQRVQAMEAVSSSPLVLYGRSIGSAVAGVLAPKLGAHGLILHTPPSSIREMAQRYLVPGPLIRHPLDSAGSLAAMTNVPTLVLEHAQDGLIPGSHVQRIVDASGGEHVIVDGGHNTYASGRDRDRAHAAMNALLDSVSGDAGELGSEASSPEGD
ncbi:MAG: alpha/beta hydrolase [Phycisphaerales bacterium]|nr:alpha/beta hydrolase [Phycisphaerales bacterium]